MLFWFFCDLLDSWSNLGRQNTPRQVDHNFIFTPFVDNGSYCGSLEYQNLRNGSVTNISIKGGIKCCFFNLLVFVKRFHLSDFLILIGLLVILNVDHEAEQLIHVTS